MNEMRGKACPVIAKHLKVALVGQPNVGKSMLINSISNAHLHVGNFTGVTVENQKYFLIIKIITLQLWIYRELMLLQTTL